MTQSHSPVPPSAKNDSVEASENLSFIREIMERSASFTAVPGWVMFFVGLTAIPATLIAARQTTADGFLLVWIIELGVALCLGVIGLRRKAHKVGVSLRSGAGRKYLLNTTPPLVAGLMLTAAFWQGGDISLLPAVWLLLYGAGTITGGENSVGLIPVLGILFMVLGTVSLLTPNDHWVLGAGFGGLHIVFGFLIARKYGG